MLRADSAADLQLLNNRVTDAIVRHRKVLYAYVAFLLIISFNGRWRVGLDSSHYRGLAANIAAGRGYVFGSWASGQVYPGFPYLLAGIEVLLGPRDRTPSAAQQQRILGPSLVTTSSVLLVLLMAAGTLLVTYRLIGLHYPPWVAITITCLLGSNALFIQHAHELLTDMPFLLGVVTALYGWDRLQLAAERSGRIGALAIATLGLLLAASMRPTFLIVAACWGLVCLWALIRGPRRRFYAICLAVLIGVWAVMFAIDPRLKGANHYLGGYEREALEMAPRAANSLWQRTYSALHDQLPAAMFGEQLAPFSVAGSLILLASAGFLLRRHALWALLVWLTFVVTVLLSSVPRYYLMILPPLLLGWLSATVWLSQRVPKKWAEAVLVGGLAIVVLNNLSRSIGFIVEQRQPNFLKHYKNGKYLATLEMCEQIRRHVRPGQRVLGPSGSIMTYLSGVHVLSARELLPRGEGPRNPRQLAEAKLDYAIFPSAVYRSKEPLIARLIERGVIVPVSRIASVRRGKETMHLMTLRIAVPPEGQDWRRMPRRARAATDARR
ncbi:hypothetical protein [Fontivita pretiosa]|uniref:hypothetical protein n=1 Tax=Fontivita pretiosa TaxID=2989684 RepID=UPI003D179EFE